MGFCMQGLRVLGRGFRAEGLSQRFWGSGFGG